MVNDLTKEDLDGLYIYSFDDQGFVGLTNKDHDHMMFVLTTKRERLSNTIAVQIHLESKYNLDLISKYMKKRFPHWIIEKAW